MYDNFRVMYYENLYLFNFFKLWGIKIIFYIFIKNILLYFFFLIVKLLYLILMWFMSYIKKINEVFILGL